MNPNRKLLIVSCFVLLLFMGASLQAAHTYAYAGITDGTTGANASDSDWGFLTVSSSAIANCPCSICGGSGGYAQTTSTVYFDGRRYVENPGVANNNIPAGHTPTNTGTADSRDIHLRACILGAIGNVSLDLAIEPVILQLPQSDLANNSVVGLNIDLGTTSIAAGLFTLSGDGSVSGSGIYDASNFDVSIDNDMWTAEYTGPETVEVELPVNTYVEFSFKSSSEFNFSEPLAWDVAEPGRVVQHLELRFPEGCEVIIVEPNSLVTHLKLDDLHPQVAIDSSPGGYFSAELSEDSPNWAVGQMNAALHFEDSGGDGQYLTISDPNLPPLESFTIAFWMKADDVMIGQQVADILERSDGAGKGFLIKKLFQSTGQMQFTIGSGVSSSTMSVSDMYVADEWVHVAWTFDSESGIQKVYKDGEYMQDDSVVIGDADAIGSIRLGKVPSGPLLQYEGLLDEFKIFNYVLDEDEIVQLLCSGPIDGDLDFNCEVDLIDFSIFASKWLDCNLLVQSLCSN